MNRWGALTYGDPCRACGFDWSTSLEEATLLVERIPDSFDVVLVRASGDERRADLDWSIGSYVCHVADNLRIWAERMAGIAAGGPREVTGYDENALAQARRYDRISLPAARWSLRRSVEDWLHIVRASSGTALSMIHPERGELSLADVAVSNAHDAIHHLWDIETTLADANDSEM